jgi:hypothetical protein
MNKLEELRALELMCKSLSMVIELHRGGLERYEDVIIRAKWLAKYIKDLEENNQSQETKSGVNSERITLSRTDSSPDTNSTKQSQGMCEFPNSPMIITKSEDTNNSKKQQTKSEILKDYEKERICKKVM